MSTSFNNNGNDNGRLSSNRRIKRRLKRAIEIEAYYNYLESIQKDECFVRRPCDATLCPTATFNRKKTYTVYWRYAYNMNGGDLDPDNPLATFNPVLKFGRDERGGEESQPEDTDGYFVVVDDNGIMWYLCELYNCGNYNLDGGRAIDFDCNIRASGDGSGVILAPGILLSRGPDRYDKSYPGGPPPSTLSLQPKAQLITMVNPLNYGNSTRRCSNYPNKRCSVDCDCKTYDNPEAVCNLGTGIPVGQDLTCIDAGDCPRLYGSICSTYFNRARQNLGDGLPSIAGLDPPRRLWWLLKMKPTSAPNSVPFPPFGGYLNGAIGRLRSIDGCGGDGCGNDDELGGGNAGSVQWSTGPIGNNNIPAAARTCFDGVDNGGHGSGALGLCFFSPLTSSAPNQQANRIMSQWFIDKYEPPPPTEEEENDDNDEATWPIDYSSEEYKKLKAPFLNRPINPCDNEVIISGTDIIAPDYVQSYLRPNESLYSVKFQNVRWGNSNYQTGIGGPDGIDRQRYPIVPPFELKIRLAPTCGQGQGQERGCGSTSGSDFRRAILFGDLRCGERKCPDSYNVKTNAFYGQYEIEDVPSRFQPWALRRYCTNPKRYGYLPTYPEPWATIPTGNAGGLTSVTPFPQ